MLPAASYPLLAPGLAPPSLAARRSYKQAFAAVITARAELERRGVPHLRPDDYFAEMLKSDAHMLRVRGKLLSEKERLEAVEARKRAQETRKFAKQVQAEKEQSRIKEKKEQADAVTEWRKQRARGGGSAVDSGKGLDMVLEGTGKGAVAASRGRTTERGRTAAAAADARSVSRKRQRTKVQRLQERLGRVRLQHAQEPCPPGRHDHAQGRQQAHPGWQGRCPHGQGRPLSLPGLDGQRWRWRYWTSSDRMGGVSDAVLVATRSWSCHREAVGLAAAVHAACVF